MRLLLIEDSEEDGLLLIRELRLQGFKPFWQRVITAQELRTSLVSNEWDVVLSDYHMPGMDALDALRVVQQTGLDIPFLIVAEKISEAEVVQALRAGACDVISRVSLNRLAPAILREMREAVTRHERRMADARLVRSERYFRALMERAADLIAVINASGLVYDVSPAITSMLGYYREELVGQTIGWLIYPDDREAAGTMLRQFVDGAQESYTLTLRAFHKSGDLRTLELIATNLLSDSAVSGVVINARDITRQAEAEAQIRRQAARAEALVRVAARLNAHLDRSTVIAAICEETARALGADIACVILPTLDGATEIVGAAGPGVSNLDYLSLTMPQAISRLFAGEAAVTIVSLGSTSREMEWSVLGAQMVRDGQPIGSLAALFGHGSRSISADDRALLCGLADQAGLALDNADLLSALKNSNDALADAYDATLEGWVHALDLRDKETEGHTRRVTAMTLHIARSMGFDEEALIQIYRGALLHDIGKLGIPDRILHKNGPLDEDEWALMRMHPVYA
ncbi:MAG: PAS domain S-box protein, partial [Oscillochloris sp.]|nr:PAS domain S-box protein [Oscillochloris sp.]